MKTMHERVARAVKLYVDEGVTTLEAKRLGTAHMAGMIDMYNLLNDIANQPDETAYADYDALHAEVAKALGVEVTGG